jgi:hypothetical protein
LVRLGIQMAESFVEMEIKRLMAHALTEAGLTSATLTGTAVREAATSASAHKDIMKDAKKAGAKGWTIGEEFPFPLNLIMPPILAATMFGGVMAYDAFEQGGNVGHTGMALLHQNEMVLPRPIAEKVRAMAEPETSGARRGGSVTNNFKIDAKDANSFRLSQRQIDDHAARASQKALRRSGL